MHSAVEYRWMESTDDLNAFREDWRALWMRDPQASPFQSPEWVLPWWQCFGQTLRGIAVRKRGTVVGFLPFYIYPNSATKQRQLLLLGVGTSDYLDGLFAPECRTEDISAALDLLLERDGWDVMCVSQLRPGSRLLEALRESTGLGAEHFTTESCSRMPAVPINCLPPKIRRNAIYYRNRAERTGKLEFVIAGPEDLDEIFDSLVRLHTARWQAEGEPGVFSDPRMVEWHRKALPLLQRTGLLRLSALRLNGEIVAVIYALLDPPARAHRSFYLYVTAFSTRHAELRPGTVLYALAIDHAACEGVHTIDLLRGDEGYKQMWHAEPFPTYGFDLRRDRGLAARNEVAA